MIILDTTVFKPITFAVLIAAFFLIVYNFMMH